MILVKSKKKKTYFSVENERVIFTCFYRSPSSYHDRLYNFCSEINLVPTNINNTKPICSTLIGGDFNTKILKHSSSDNYNVASINTNNITTAAGCNQVINKPTHFINITSSCIDQFLSTNMRVIRKYGIKEIITTLHIVLSNCN